MERLQKYIASCGIASRRKAEELIIAGRVKVNGNVVTELGTKVGSKDVITVDEKVVSTDEHIYLTMNKPRGVLSTACDDLGRKTVIKLLEESHLGNKYKGKRLFPIGRLDYDTKGIILLTNDGEFMNHLVGPQSNLEKEYLARVEGIFTKEHLKKICSGVKIDDYKTRNCYGYIKDTDTKNNSTLVGLVIKEGKYHQVKRMFLALGFNVKKLSRVRFGEITTEGIKEGEVRELTLHEVKRLYALSLGGKK